MDDLVKQVCELARRAGEKVMHFYDRDAAVTWKKDSSPLTLADSASHDFLVAALQRLTPDIPVVSEESEEGAAGSVPSRRRFWLVDPLDGTKEFIKRTNEFTVNVALVENGRPVAGVVHAPALALTYYGVKNFGAWRQDGDARAARISTRQANPAGLAVVASKDHAGPLVASLLTRLANPRLQSMGSSLKFCLVAESTADLYLRDLPTMEWDTAAAQCVVEAAGGGVFTLDGRTLRYAKPGLKNPAIMTVGDLELDWKPLLGVAAVE
jgi:3'(2'), 5'-bisphosphate nucleotidase